MIMEVGNPQICNQRNELEKLFQLKPEGSLQAEFTLPQGSWSFSLKAFICNEVTMTPLRETNLLYPKSTDLDVELIIKYLHSNV